MTNIDTGELADLWRDNKEPEFLAISYAIKMAVIRLKTQIDSSQVYAGIQNLQEDAVDELATELQVQYYDNSLPLSTKRELVSNSLKWHSHAGTPSAVKELIQSVFGSGQLIEWYENGGDPFTFEIKTDTTITPTIISDLERMISKVKNAKSRVSSVVVHRIINANPYAGGIESKNEKIFLAAGRNIKCQTSVHPSVGSDFQVHNKYTIIMKEVNNG